MGGGPSWFIIGHVVQGGPWLCLDFFKLVQACSLGGKFEGDLDFFLVGAGLGHLGFLLDPSDLIDIIFMMAVGGNFPHTDNEGTLTSQATDPADPSGGLLCGSHWGIALENTPQTFLLVFCAFGCGYPYNGKCPGCHFIINKK